ncbi:hypothetical protein [Methylorubrum extorquens]
MGKFDKSLVAQIRGELARRRGRKYALSEVDNISKFDWPLDAIEKNRAETPLKYELKYRNIDKHSFAGGWRDCWRSLGEIDATEGVCRTTLFKNNEYNHGWFSMVLHKRRQGWEHKNFSSEFDRLQKHFIGPRL